MSKYIRLSDKEVQEFDFMSGYIKTMEGLLEMTEKVGYKKLSKAINEINKVADDYLEVDKNDDYDKILNDLYNTDTIKLGDILGVKDCIELGLDPDFEIDKEDLI